MNYNTIRKLDISNGPGTRVSIFTQGCPHHCDGCFNPETWPFTGKVFTQEIMEQVLSLCEKEHCSGLSILGGEPLIGVNLEGLKCLFKEFKKRCPNKTIWLWTGYTVEKLNEKQWEVVRLCDTIIDGPFIKDKKDTALYYAGSTNQRLFDVLPQANILAERKMPSLNDKS